MGWFDSQLREREQLDNKAFTDSFLDMAESVMAGHEYARFRNEKDRAESEIARILQYYHLKPKKVPDNIKDFYDQVEFLMRPNGIMFRNVILKDRWYRDAYGPMIGTLAEGNVRVALIPDGLGRYHYIDPTSGRSMKVNAKTCHLLTEEALCFYKPFPLRAINFKEFAGYLISTVSGLDIAMTLLVSAMATLVGLLLPRLTNILLVNAQAGMGLGFLPAMVMFLTCASVSSILLSTVNNALTERISARMDLSVEAATMMRILSLPADFFKKYSSGELSVRADYVRSLGEMVVSGVLSVGITSLFSLAYISQIFTYAPALVTPAIVIILITIGFSLITTFANMRISQRQMELSAKESGLSYELISGIQKIKLSGAEKRAFSKWASLYATEANLTYNPPMFLKISSVISLAITSVGTIVMYGAAIRSGITVENYYAFNVAYGTISGAFMSLASTALTIARIKPVFEMVKPLFETEPEISEGKKVVTRVSGAIEVNHVTFRYSEDMPAVLDDLSLKIDPGQYVAIVGKTGCGKSTLLRLLLGFETTDKGTIYYDQKDIKTLDLKSLRRKIGTVMQNGKLFSGDIYSNIVISAPWLSLDDAWEAAELADIADDINDMPMGMFTFLMEGTGGISGGQKQRLMIARAIAPKPKILFFDEATSALDNISQKKISNSLAGLKCTRVVIAHRLSTVKDCDRIIVLDGGHIIEDGTYDELIQQKGFFAELVKRQQINEDAE